VGVVQALAWVAAWRLNESTKTQQEQDHAGSNTKISSKVVRFDVAAHHSCA
jgi:hypothetical protein